MKKNLFLFTMVCIALTIVSCGDDEETPKQKTWPAEITLKIGESYSLAGATVYGYNDSFVLTTTWNVGPSGKETSVVGSHIGTDVVGVMDETGEHQIKVTVVGDYYSFPDPVTKWLSSPEQVKQLHQGGTFVGEEEPTEENPYTTLYYTDVDKASVIQYSFSDNQLIYVGVLVKRENWDEVSHYLKERFQLHYEGRWGDYALAGTNAVLYNFNTSVEYKNGQWVDVYTNQPALLFTGGDYTTSFTSTLLTEENIIQIDYRPNYSKLEDSMSI